MHLLEFPKADNGRINKKLEEEVEIAKQIIESALAARDEAKIGLRWPLAELSIDSADKKILEAVKKTSELLKKQLNVKRISFGNVKEGTEFKGGKLAFDTKLTAELLAEGFAREIVRRVQDLRKQAALRKEDKIELQIKVDKELQEILTPQLNEIKERVNATKLEISEEKFKKAQRESKFKVRDKEIAIALSKV